MITGSSHEGSGRYLHDKVEVRVEVEVSDTHDVSTEDVLQALDNALHGALASVGMFAPRQVIDAWHEQRGNESREARGF